MSSDYTLSYGTHATAQDGRCAMEWVSHLAGEPHSDMPACVSPVLRAFCVALNDGLADGPRQRLRPYLARTIGTAGDGLDPDRAWLAMDWLTRTYAPAWLSLAGLDDSARDLRAAAPLSAIDQLLAALDLLGPARRRAADAWRSSGAVRLATGRLARVSARATAWSAAPAAAWAAARCGVGNMAGDRARAAARAIAGDAAATVARGARLRETGSDGGPAPRLGDTGDDGARASQAGLAPTLNELQDSVFALLEQMLPTIAVALPELARSDRAPTLA
jgi:hypothetical protein